MNTAPLKRFATVARQKLMRGVESKIRDLGFDDNGVATVEPESIPGGTDWKGQILPVSFYDQWQSLRRRIQEIGLQEVKEEAAYTWFNRLVAIRILTSNSFIEPVLRFAPETHVPYILDEARQMHLLTDLSEDKRVRLQQLLADNQRQTEAFALLIAEFCHHNFILQSSFGGIKDYTEILLPNDILQDGALVDMLNGDEYITDEDCRTPELIGWLYQFYISERKDEVMKKDKYKPEEIPAATQIFTPNWIVKYMVENTLGRIYLDSLRDEDEIARYKKEWKYLVEPAQPLEEPTKRIRPRNLKVADFSCGSGHILNECFNMLYEFYIDAGASPDEAVENILTNNLVGIDLDDRACQLSRFSLMLKSAQRYNGYVNGGAIPHILGMPRPQHGDLHAALHEFFRGDETPAIMEEMDKAFDLLKKAESLGSIMKFDMICADTRFLIKQRMEYWADKPSDSIPAEVSDLFPSFRLILALTESYDAVVMNPPYMPTNKDAILNAYARKKYPDSKADLFAVFMDVAYDRLRDGGKYGMINMQSWMFLTSFESLRSDILNNQIIDSMLHLGPHTFDELNGEVVQNSAFVITKNTPGEGVSGTYIRLTEGKDCKEKEEFFFKSVNYFRSINQTKFFEIPGSPIGYWVSDNIRDAFANDNLSKYGYACIGMRTGDNQRFLRQWFEVNDIKLALKDFSQKWVPYNKGGEFRRWYGNNEYVVNWENNGEEIKENTRLHYPELGDNLSWKISNENYYFRSGITWTGVSTKDFNCRWYPEGFIFDSGANGLFPEKGVDIHYLLAFLNGKISNMCLRLLNPTINYGSGTVRQVPLIYKPSERIIKLAKDNISISKADWDAHETSWDFQRSPLIVCEEEGKKEVDGFNPTLLEDSYEAWKSKWNRLFNDLLNNEIELNRQFIDIYGLQDELTPDVPMKDITILQQGEISIEKIDRAGMGVEEKTVWHPDVVMKQLISYAIGVWMGRYRLDRPGLNIAHPNPSAEELAPYTYNGQEVEIDDDAIIPILPDDAPFDDNAAKRVKDFLRIVWGTEHISENINFMEAQMDSSIEAYMMDMKKGWWKDHLTMYSRRPIYWLFASKKGAFKAMAYMHRMTPATVKRIREDYLLRYIEYLNSTIAKLEAREGSPTTKEKAQLKKMRTDLAECQDYDDEIQRIADRAITFDLDDGVVHNHALFGPILAKLK